MQVNDIPLFDKFYTMYHNMINNDKWNMNDEIVRHFFAFSYSI